MATETNLKETKAAAPEPVKNCAGCNKPLKRAKRYYRNGKYFANKKSFNLYVAQEAEKASKAKEVQAVAQAAAPAAEPGETLGS